MTNISDLQDEICRKRYERGFVTDPLKVYALLTEEVGEIAAELKKLWSPNYGGFEVEMLADEIADAFVLLSALASSFDIEIGASVERKFLD